MTWPESIRSQSVLLIVGLAVVFALSKTSIADGHPILPVAVPTTSYSHDAKGLEKQYDPLLKAYSKGNLEEIDKEFAIFLLRDPSKWIVEYFAPGDVDKLLADYQKKADVHKKGFLTITTKVLHTSERFHVHCTPPDAGHQTKVQPRPDAPTPIREVPIEQFEVKFSTNDGKRLSELVNFVYVDGAFRYLGNGSFPFWSQPPQQKKSAPEAESE